MDPLGDALYRCTAGIVFMVRKATLVRTLLSDRMNSSTIA